MAALTKCAILSLLAGVSLAAQTRRYNFTITNKWDVGDGHGRPVFAINNETPGPLIEAEEGDEVEVFLDNQLAFETTMHWHGIYQIDRPWNDGVPGVTQYSIQPRDTYTYRFTVQQQYGSYFYHGHFGPAFADGMRGPIWIAPAAWRPRPYELISSSPRDIEGMKRAEEHPKHVVISDWNAEPMDILLIMYRDTGIVPWCSNSIVLNGKGRTVCHPRELLDSVGGPGRNSLGCLPQNGQKEFANEQTCQPTFADLEIFEANSGEEWIWINFIHSGAHHELQISVDEHEFYVVAADGEFVHPQKVHAANCNLGERISILVRLNQKPGDYAIRLTSLRPEQVIQGFGILRYPDQGNELKQEIPNTKPWVHLNGTLISSSSVAMDETKLAPYPVRTPPPKADNTVKFFVNMTGPSSWALNIGPHQAFRQQLPPLLWDEESRGETTYGDNTQGGALQNGTVVDIIFENGANVTSQHPFHKHNNKAFVIGTGTGGFPWPTVEDAIREGDMAKHFNLINPPNRDGCRLGNSTGDWTVIRYEIAFPAASMLHCHMIHHFAAGQQVVLLEGVESMAKIPAEMKDRVHSDFTPPLRYGPLD
ncbi:laccase TilA [Colletotrichum scovillei]|uniref:Laccase TilA n=1 Tax=Colletotrichum scovillei TaxID=1209932 RepID=A0A9P7QU46_9PEZI|nr:laccase TilA [Colletotrichum scovillei]KAF4780932.1 laccase TilA [Colletotrichum scovillei]KAG7039301.1 laccase TilA [Colletotrichum scovillei]KAG7041482.1 laccase TilA [Colletotrichum scovillei]KAG7061513.1 laccase TilA [Colletotrichum scovillei]